MSGAKGRTHAVTAWITLAVLLLLAVECSAGKPAAKAAATAPVADHRLTLEQCEELGFQREVVQCRYCETLLAHTGSTELQQECLGCCTSSKEDEKEVVYTSATIVTPYLQRVLSNPTNIARFMTEYSGEQYFTKVTLEDAGTRPIMPELVLRAKEGDDLRIQLYRLEPHKIHELLSKKLKV